MEQPRLDWKREPMTEIEAGAPAPKAALAGAHPSGPAQFINVISKACLLFSGFALVLIVLINGVNVFCRYVLFWALSWAEEAMVFLMIMGVFVGAITVTWERIHIRIDAFVNMTKGGWRLAAEWLAVAITAAVLLPIGWISFGVVLKLKGFDQRSDALDLPVWIPQVAMPFALLGIPIVMALVLLLRGAEDRKPH